MTPFPFSHFTSICRINEFKIANIFYISIGTSSYLFYRFSLYLSLSLYFSFSFVLSKYLFAILIKLLKNYVPLRPCWMTSGGAFSLSFSPESVFILEKVLIFCIIISTDIIFRIYPSYTIFFFSSAIIHSKSFEDIDESTFFCFSL